MAFDYKKEYKEFYLPPRRPQIVEVPEMRFVAVRGSGNPNEEGGEYKTAMQLRKQHAEIISFHAYIADARDQLHRFLCLFGQFFFFAHCLSESHFMTFTRP